jgi:hypothetical protein
MGKTVELNNNDFALPAYRTGVEVLLLLAEAINEVFSSPGAIDVSDSSKQGDWISLLRLLGKLNVDPQTRISQTALISDLWDTFFRQNDVKGLENQVLALFKNARDRSVARATSGTSIVGYLDQANELGHGMVRKLLKKHGADKLLAPSPTAVEVFYDGAGQNYCAGSSIWTNRIRVAYQSVPHALLGTVIADLVFAHEYFSHLVPRNKHLNSTVREQWLVAALREALEEDKLALFWKTRLWTPYRSALESHVVALARVAQPDASVVRYSGVQGAEEQLRLLAAKHRKLFWHLTVEVLKSNDDREIAEKASQIATSLATRGLPTLVAAKIRSINDLANIIQ